MSNALLESQERLQPEYSIYIYHHPDNYVEGWNDWEKRSVTYDLKAALIEAETLYASNEFQRVEIKEKIYDERRQRPVDHTYKVFDEDEGQPLSTNTALMIWACMLFVLGIGVKLMFF